MSRSYPPEYRRRGLDLLESGKPVTEVAAGLELTAQTIWGWWNLFTCCGVVRSMKLIVGVVVVIVSVVLGGPAVAGGWAVSTLDSVPAPTAGQVIDVGFTIRQHGVSPVNPDGEVGIVISSPTGAEEFFSAQPVGQVGHYVAEVTFSESGSWTWAVRQGWFADQDLGSVEVSRAGTEPAGASTYRWPGWVRFGLPLLALVFGALAVVELAVGRRRRLVAA